MIKFNSIIVEGFGSIGNTLQFPLDRHGINLIKGRNGAGKTSVFNALAWCAYGTNLKGVTNGNIPTWKNYRPSSFKGTRVALFLTKDNVNYAIVRHLQFKGITFGLKGDNSLMILKGVTPDQLDSTDTFELETSALFKSNQQEYINQLIGMDYKVFINSILFGQRMTRLISASGTEKRQIFEEIFDTIWLSQAKDKAKEKHDHLTIEIEQLQSSIKSSQREIELLTEQLEKSKKVVEEFEGTKTTLISRKKETCSRLEKEIQEIQELEQEESLQLTELEEQLNLVTSLVDAFDSSDLDKVRAKLKSSQKGMNAAKDVKSKVWHEYEAEKKKLKQLNDEYENLLSANESRRSKYSKQIQVELKALEEVNTTCHACGKLIDSDKVDGVKANIQSEIEKLNMAIQQIDLDDEPKKLYEEIEAQKKYLQDEDFEGRLKIHDTTIEDYIQQIATLVKQEEELSKGVVQLEREQNTAQSKLNAHIKQFRSTKLRLSDYTKQLEEAKKDLKSAQDMTPPVINFQEYEDKILACQAQMDTDVALIEKSKDLQSKYKFWYSKGFSSTGMSSYIFGVMMDELNACTHKYAERVGLSIKMGIDLDKVSKPFYTKVLLSDGLEVNHQELSGGEQQLVDVCIAFGTQELVSKLLPLLILDEVFEGLDSENITKVFDFVRLKVEQGKDVYIITHQSNLDFKYTKTIEVEKVGKMTKVILN